MEARFFCKTGPLAGSEHRIGDDATIGRESQNTIMLADDLVSKQHARIAFDPVAAAYFLEDLNSTNGTRLDGVPVSGRARLGDVHVVTVGEQHDFIFVVLPGGRSEARPAEGEPEPRAAQRDGAPTHHEPLPAAVAPPLATNDDLSEPKITGGEEPSGEGVEAAEPPAEPATRYEAPSVLVAPRLGGDESAAEASAAGPLPGEEPSAERVEAAEPPAEPATRYEVPSALAVPPLGGQPSEPSGVVVEIQTADGARSRVTLADGRHVLGRAGDCDLPVDDRTLSRRHAAFVVQGDRLSVSDLDSLNGTFVDETPIENATRVGVGQAVTFGDRVKVVRVAS